MKKELLEKIEQPKYLLPIIIILAAVLRIIFFNGHVFSDDSYYAHLAHSYSEGNFGSDFLGYPIHLVRKLMIFFTMFSFMIFGEGELATVFFPFLFSLLSIIIIYFIAYELTGNKKVSLFSSFVLAVLPTDIIFASINFADLIAAFLINFGIYYVIKFIKTSEMKYAYFAGLYFAISIFAKMSFYYIGILILILAFLYLKKNKKISIGLILSAVIPLLLLVIEGIIIGAKTGNYFYRFQILEANYQSTYYNFFPYTVLGDSYTNLEYFWGLLKQIFVENIKNLFLRRFYLLIPLFALIGSFLFIKQKRNSGLVFWFLGLTLLMIGFTTSPTSYKPLDFKMSWYAYPLFFPAIIIFSETVISYTKKYLPVIIILLFTGSMYMSTEYQNFFDIEEKNKFKDFIHRMDDEFVFTDHHTKYAVDLIRGYDERVVVSSLSNKPTLLSELPKYSLVIFNEGVVNELQLQGYSLPNFELLKTEQFKMIEKYSDFEVYRKTE